MKGILLAGGSGTRLRPFSSYLSKQLMPVYNKPLIYYPLSTLMLAGIKDIIIVSTPHDTPNYQNLLGDGSELGLNLEYVVQENPNGIAEPFILCADLIKDEDVCMILGDNIFYGSGFREILKDAKESAKYNNAAIFGYNVKDPERFGVIEHDKYLNVLSLEEKPSKPKSNVASVGLYFFPNDVVKKAKNLKPSDRGELEITDINNLYLSENRLELRLMHRGFSYFDAGTIDSLAEASNFIKTIEDNTSFKIGLIEEIAYNEGYIDRDQMLKAAKKYEKTDLYEYIEGLE